MGWHKFVMKHGIGSPGHIAANLAEAYRVWKIHAPLQDEQTVIRAIFLNRAASQTIGGGPLQYQLLKSNAEAIDELVRQHPDLFSIVMLSIFIEHPELVGPYSRDDTFHVLDETVQEVLDKRVPGWRRSGIWNVPNMSCSMCKERIERPDASTMYASINEAGIPEYLCPRCAIPLPLRAMSDLGFFMGDRFRWHSLD